MSDAEHVPHCPHCIEPQPQLAHFCVHCGMPLTFYATTAPLESVWAFGWLVARLLDQRPRRLVVVGTWVMALPATLVVVTGGTAAFLGDLTGLAAMIPAACYLLLAVRVTVAYLRNPPAPDAPPRAV